MSESSYGQATTQAAIYMTKLISSCLVLTAPAACSLLPRTDAASLDHLQGAWWSDCRAPAAEFLINGSEYSGDFLGTHKLYLAGDVMTFSAGLADGHSVDVTHRSASFRILSATGKQLILRPMRENPYVGDWHLRSCKGQGA